MPLFAVSGLSSILVDPQDLIMNDITMDDSWLLVQILAKKLFFLKTFNIKIIIKKSFF